MIQARLFKVWHNGFVRSVSVLVGGTAFAQFLMVLILPLLTRFYSPADFTVLAVYASILGIFASIACLRLEIAIPIPESDEDAVNLLALALFFATIFGLFWGALVWFFSDELTMLTGQPAFEPFLWLVPLGVWLSGSYSALQFWATREKQFSLIAKTRISQATGSATIQVGLGWVSITPLGLLLGQLVNSGSGVIGLGASIWRHHRDTLHLIRPRKMLDVLRVYQRYPRYSILEALANNGNIQIPILIIASLAAGPEAGFLMLATRIMAAPVGLVGGAISQVYLSRAPEEKRQGQLGIFTGNIIGGLLRTGVGPIFFIGTIAPVIFPPVFGAEWARAGDIITWMSPWFVMQFLASPISMVLHINNRQKTAVVLQVVGLIMRVGAVLFAAYAAPSYIVESYAVSSFAFYSIYFSVVLRSALSTPRELIAPLLGAWFPLAAWLLMAAIAHIFIKCIG